MSVNSLNISVLQYNPVWENAKVNFDAIAKQIEGLSDTDLLVLPEMFSTGFSMDSLSLADNMQGETIEWMKSKSKLLNAAVCGSAIIKQNNIIYNRFLFVTEDEVHYYDKRHLFRMGEEHNNFQHGDTRTIVNYRGCNIMLQICYDLRFPVWSRNQNEYDVLIYTANWPSSRRIVWDTLLKARALENQSVVIGCNRIGVDGREIKYNGGSQIINERGEVLALASDSKEEIIQHTIDINQIRKFRNDFPVWKDADSFEISQ